MAWRERTRGERRAPPRESADRATLDVHLDPADRAGGAPAGKPAGRARGAKPATGTPKRTRRAKRPLVLRLTYWSAVFAVWAGLAMLAFVGWHAAHLPPVQSLELPKRPPTVQIIGIDGRALATRGEMGGAAVPLRSLPAHVPHAFIAIEDRRFREHWGVDPKGIARALAANVLRRGVAQGGSTLTQQLAKNLFLTQERTFERKVQELVLALWLERKLSKDQILELYLNRVYFGAGAYGLEAAAQRYFAKPAKQLSLAEAAMLAGVVKAPGRLAPTRNEDAAQRRAATVLAAMAEQGFVTRQQAVAALGQPAEVAQRQTGGSLGYVADWVMDVLDSLVGRVEEDVTVITTIDPILQGSAERALMEALARDGERQQIGQGALVAMDPDGAVRALVGGRDYAHSQFNRAVTARRQPGSAFKPVVFLSALEKGLTPDTVRLDAPLDVKGWKPENYTREYRGPVTLTAAMAQSINTVAVRLALEAGPRAVVATARRLGIGSNLEANASIALGTSEVSLLELSASYAVLANGGLPVRPVVVERIKAASGKTLYVRRADGRPRVIDMRHVAMMNAMLEEVVAGGTGRRADVPGWRIAGKTGTTQEFRDAWFVGFTGRLVAGVWFGNDDNSPMRKVTGGGLPADVWSRFMRESHRGWAPVELPGARGFFAAARSQVGPAPPDFDPARPLPSDVPSLDAWLLDRLFGRR